MLTLLKSLTWLPTAIRIVYNLIALYGQNSDELKKLIDALRGAFDTKPVPPIAPTPPVAPNGDPIHDAVVGLRNRLFARRLIEAGAAQAMKL